MIHNLKTWSQYFERVVTGEKTFEVRKNDRGFQVGDTLNLIEVNAAEGMSPTGREQRVNVTYVLPGGEFGIEQGYCVMGIKLEQLP